MLKHCASFSQQIKLTHIGCSHLARGCFQKSRSPQGGPKSQGTTKEHFQIPLHTWLEIGTSEIQGA